MYNPLHLMGRKMRKGADAKAAPTSARGCPQSLRPGGPTCQLQKSRCEPLAERPIPGTESHALWVSQK